MKCDSCKKEARWQISAHGRHIHRNMYACDDCRQETKKAMESELTLYESDLGNPFFPQVSKLGFGPIATTLL